MCRGVVNVYACRHREVGQIHMCSKAYNASKGSGCWPSFVYFMTGHEPSRQCDQTTTDRRYVGELCWSCSRGLSQPLEAMDSRSHTSRSYSHPRTPPLAPQAYRPEPMMTATTRTPNSVPTLKAPAPAIVVSPPTLISSSNNFVSRGIISLPSAPSSRQTRPLRPPRSPPTNSSSSASPPSSSPSRRVRAPGPLSSSQLPSSRPTTSRSRPSRSGATGLGLTGSSSSPMAFSSNMAVPPTRPRPTLPSSSTSSARFASPSSSSTYSSFSRPRPVGHQLPKTPGVAIKRTQPPKTLKTPSTLAPSATNRSQKGFVSRISAALRSPKSTESFACADARRVERGAERGR